MNLLTMLHKSVEADPDKECLLYKDGDQYRSINYRQFWDSIQEFATGLRELGVTEGDKVGILSGNCPQWAISDYAIMWLGAVVVPIYHTLTADQIEFILHNADISCLLVEDEVQLEKIAHNWPPHLKFVVSFKETVALEGKQILSFDTVLNIGKRVKAEISPPDFNQIPPEQLATIVHTSGTSGKPKGVMLSHKNVVSNIRASISCLPVDPSDIALSFLPLSHIFERTVGQFTILSSGATIAYAESIEKIQQNLQEVRPTILCTVPRLLEKIYAGIQQKTKKIKALPFTSRLVGILIKKKLHKGMGGRLRCIVSGGAGLAANIAEFFTQAGLPVHEGYGMTEAAPVICVNPMDQARPGTVGKPLPGVEIRISGDGELLVRGPNVMQGYYKDPAATAESFTDDGWLRTGDIASLHDGYVSIVDRKKNILVLATGKNVAPWPIENRITLSPYISEALLVGDHRNYLTCLLVPDFAALQQYAEAKQLGKDRADWLKSPEIKSLLRREVMQATEKFADFERPKRAAVLSEELTMEAGDLTPTLKIRNKIILSKYGDRIEAMYQGKEYLPIFEDSEPETVTKQTSGQLYKSPIWKIAAAGLISGMLFRIWLGV